MSAKIARLGIAGLSGDSGKTVVSLAVIAALKNKSLSVAAFKKGPDYIDSAWLSAFSGIVCRNLDTFLVNPSDVKKTFTENASKFDVAIIEGNRGIFDGKDVQGTYSTAELSRLLAVPQVLVVNATKATRTIAALIKGCMEFDPELNIAGVILNKIAGERHRKIITEAIHRYCGVPVLGSIPKLGGDEYLIPGRHLGLVTPAEFAGNERLTGKLIEIAENYIDIDRLIEIARSASPLEMVDKTSEKAEATGLKIGYFRDSVFTFYYPENLEALQNEGAELIAISSMDNNELPDIDALYIGGGFPETQAEKLAAKKTLMESVKRAAENGLPVYAECGGLIYLTRSIGWKGRKYDMTGLFPVDLVMNEKPVGHGYTELVVDRPNPFFDIISELKGHEFHYSSISTGPVDTGCMAVKSGTGTGHGRDGMVYKNVLALYTHIHADGVKSWAPAIIKKAGEYHAKKKKGIGRDYKMAV